MFIPTLKILDEEAFCEAFGFGYDVYLLETMQNRKGFRSRLKLHKLQKAISDYLAAFDIDYDALNKTKDLIIYPLGDCDPTIMNVALAGYYNLAIFEDCQQSANQKSVLEAKWTERMAPDLPENPGYGKQIFDEIYDRYRLADDEKSTMKRMEKKAFADTYGHLKQGRF